MPSLSLQRWFAERAGSLNDIESAHRSVHGSGPGARAASQQINQAYAVLLTAQFQGFCRDLHSESADHFVMPITNPDLRDMLRDNLVFGRKIDRGNPTPGNPGSDFNRFNLAFWSRVECAPVPERRAPDCPGRTERLAERHRPPRFLSLDVKGRATQLDLGPGTDLAESM